MIVGLDIGIDALTEIRHLSRRNDELQRIVLLEQLITNLLESRNPFLLGLADAIEDGLIHSTA